MHAISPSSERDGLAGAVRRLLAPWRWRSGALLSALAAASGIDSIYEWQSPEHVLCGVIAITAAIQLGLGARNARRALCR